MRPAGTTPPPPSVRPSAQWTVSQTQLVIIPSFFGRSFNWKLMASVGDDPAQLTALRRVLDSADTLAGCLSGLMQKNCQLTAEIETAKAETEQLQCLNQELKAVIQHLGVKNARVTDQNEDLKASNQSLSADNKHLKAQNEELVANNEGLRTESERLKEEIQELKSKNEALVQQLRQGFSPQFAVDAIFRSCICVGDIYLLQRTLQAFVDGESSTRTVVAIRGVNVKASTAVTPAGTAKATIQGTSQANAAESEVYNTVQAVSKMSGMPLSCTRSGLPTKMLSTQDEELAESSDPLEDTRATDQKLNRQLKRQRTSAQDEVAEHYHEPLSSTVDPRLGVAIEQQRNPNRDGPLSVDAEKSSESGATSTDGNSSNGQLPKLSIESFAQLDAARPWDLVFARRSKASHMFNYWDLSSNAKRWIRRILWFQFAFRRELWEWMHWIDMDARPDDIEWEGYRRFRLESAEKMSKAWKVLRIEMALLIRQGDLTASVWNDPSIWCFNPTEPLKWQPSSSNLIEEQAKEDIRHSVRCFYTNQPQDHPFYKSGLKSKYPDVYSLPPLASADRMFGVDVIPVNNSNAYGAVLCPTSWGTTEFAPKFMVVPHHWRPN